MLATRPRHEAANATPPAALQARVLCHRHPLAGRDSLQSREAGTGKNLSLVWEWRRTSSNPEEERKSVKMRVPGSMTQEKEGQCGMWTKV